MPRPVTSIPTARPIGAAAPAAPASPDRQRLVAIGLMCLAVVMFSGCDTTAKWLGRSIDPMMTAWARYASNVLWVGLFLNPITTPGILATRRLGLQVFRSVLLVGCTVLNFYALRYLQLTQTTAIQFAMPLLVALLAGPMLGEWAGPRRLAAIGVGFAGVLVVTRPGLGSLHPAALLSVVGTVLYAIYALVTRVLARHDSSATTLAYSGLAGLAILTPVLPFVWSNPPGPLVWLGMLAVGGFAALGHWLLILAHARAPAPVLSPFIYTQIVWMTGSGYLVFGDLPDGWTVVGAAIVVASGLYLLWWERRHRGPAA
ncbi:MAG: DMT family transporter [Methylobacteriaceae bacterium]|nr:DMT family transporter [Methylobacteriaceae bacterium]